MILSELPILISMAGVNRMWYSVPLIAVISLVYAATRHEVIKPILEHAVRFGFWIVGFMLVVFVLLMFVSAWL
ncbi:MAG: hypothetical protein CMJ80_11810 [Planctomycetaceae bacterium]|nr:hypothetical protein [Planctomycetaceae bacterium]